MSGRKSTCRTTSKETSAGSRADVWSCTPSSARTAASESWHCGRSCGSCTARLTDQANPLLTACSIGSGLKPPAQTAILVLPARCDRPARAAGAVRSRHDDVQRTARSPSGEMSVTAPRRRGKRGASAESKSRTAGRIGRREQRDLLDFHHFPGGHLAASPESVKWCSPTPNRRRQRGDPQLQPRHPCAESNTISARRNVTTGPAPGQTIRNSPRVTARRHRSLINRFEGSTVKAVDIERTKWHSGR